MSVIFSEGLEVFSLATTESSLSFGNTKIIVNPAANVHNVCHRGVCFVFVPRQLRISRILAKYLPRRVGFQSSRPGFANWK